jgi:hypothetical protein
LQAAQILIQKQKDGGMYLVFKRNVTGKRVLHADFDLKNKKKKPFARLP